MEEGQVKELMAWSDQFSVGIASIDGQHQKLVKLINQLHAAMLSGEVAEKMASILAELIDYTKTHFAYEEKLFMDFEYPELESHKAIHDALATKVLDLQAKVEAGQSVMGMEVMNFLKDWLTNHILGVDKQYGPFLAEHGVL